MAYRLGVDIGGTFTDFLLTDETGEKSVYKTLTTPRDPSEGLFDGIGKIAEERGIRTRDLLAQVEAVIHGTTITTNAALTGRGALTGFLTTRGFRDALNMRRGLKERQYDFKYSPPPPLVERHLVRTVEERVDCDGRIVTPLNEGHVKEAASYFRQMKVEAVAVGLMFSFLNPAHERRAGDILRSELPGVYISLSSEILPQIRFYERNSTTALNASVGPILSRYLHALKERLAAEDFYGVLRIMQSNGGVMAPEVAERFAANTLLSGPAGGPTAGLFYAETHGLDNFITVDMGGTSFDACLVVNGKPVITTEGQVGGHHLALPMINIHTIGAGGGSIAWISEGGMLEVGPQSAGSDPGPVCYGRGGTEPTVTDADLLLGYLDPRFFFGGEIQLDASAARKAIEERIARPLGMDAVAAADGIYRIINAKMADALRVVSVERGYDPREFALIVAGGAGPIHAGMIALEVEIPTIIIPRESSVFCAAGMLFSNLQHDFVRTCTMPFETLDRAEVSRRLAEMTRKALETLGAEGIAREKTRMEYSADIRYIGQFNEVDVPFDFDGNFPEEQVDTIAGAFHARHDQLYGYSLPGAALELINLRLTSRGLTRKPSLRKAERARGSLDEALKGHRDVYFNGGFIRTPVYDGLRMGYGHTVGGPCVVEQPTTTLIVPSDYALALDEYNNYVMIHLELASAQIKDKFGRI